MRGEYPVLNRRIPGALELPPRARRIPIDDVQEVISRGTTSACAENTDGLQNALHMVGNYLRVRGEYDL